MATKKKAKKKAPRYGTAAVKSPKPKSDPKISAAVGKMLPDTLPKNPDVYKAQLRAATAAAKKGETGKPKASKSPVTIKATKEHNLRLAKKKAAAAKAKAVASKKKAKVIKKK